ncbi:MAG: 2-oxo acid dehydrogenase subunit E2 [Bacteroidales bacterium]|nr:2-oxo acid dehydrogenase subunit E2 [Bacteroidales bacterium]
MKVLQEIKIPQESVNDEYVSVVQMFFENNEFVEIGDVLIELESSKTIFAIESQVDGYIKYFCKEEQDVSVGEIIIQIFDQIVENQLVEVKKTHLLFEEKIENTIFSKKALLYIEQNNIDNSKFKNFDFVNLDDVFLILGLKNSSKNEEKTQKTIQINVDETKVLLEDISKNKKREIDYLKAVQYANLNSLVNINIDTKGLFLKINPHLKYLKNSLLPVIIFETSKLLKKYPEFNAYFVDNQIAIFKDINVGFAIDMDNGLKTVKISDTVSKSIQQIEKEVFELSNKYIDNKLSVDDLSDITFTITDLSSEGASSFVPLINKNNSAIIGVSANDEKLDRTTISLAFDHRVTAGKKATIFLRELKNRIESYAQRESNEIDKSIKCYKCFKSLNDDFNDVGFLKVVVKNGQEKYICQTCFTGF